MKRSSKFQLMEKGALGGKKSEPTLSSLEPRKKTRLFTKRERGVLLLRDLVRVEMPRCRYGFLIEEVKIQGLLSDKGDYTNSRDTTIQWYIGWLLRTCTVLKAQMLISFSSTPCYPKDRSSLLCTDFERLETLPSASISPRHHSAYHAIPESGFSSLSHTPIHIREV